MSTDEKKGGQGRPEPIRVKQLYFGMDKIDVPGLSLVGAVASTEGKYKLEFLPWLRHHRITWTPGGSQEPVVRMVHETRVSSWEPL